MQAATHTVSLRGALGHVIDVQVDVSPGKAATALVGRPDVAINEARDRCRAAVDNSGFDWPVTRRITILLSPADVPKHGSHFDLAMAVCVVAACDQRYPRAALSASTLIGELTLDGRVRCVPGVVPMVMAAQAHGLTRVYVPEPQVAEAALVPGMEVVGIRSLAQALALIGGWEEVPDAPPVDPVATGPLLRWRGSAQREEGDLADVYGAQDARFALEIAAVGGHHLHLTGPRGSGKTTLAERLPGLLPDLDPDERLELTAVHSLAGTLGGEITALTRPPFRAPHHSASRAGVLGGGTGRVRPGEVSKAHLGVLFLDEFPLFPADVVEALREPLESGVISISRGEEDAVYPARSLVVLASNPCPCGEYHPFARTHRCSCEEIRRRAYRRKLTGPVMDRVDITRFVEPVAAQDQDDRFPPESSAVVRDRVRVARARQRRRYAGHDWRLNGHVPGSALKELWPLTDAAARRLRTELLSGRLTQRGAVRVHRLAWSVADAAGVTRPGSQELEVALRLRAATPLDLATVTREEVG